MKEKPLTHDQLRKRLADIGSRSAEVRKELRAAVLAGESTEPHHAALLALDAELDRTELQLAALMEEADRKAVAQRNALAERLLSAVQEQVESRLRDKQLPPNEE